MATKNIMAIIMAKVKMIDTNRTINFLGSFFILIIYKSCNTNIIRGIIPIKSRFIVFSILPRPAAKVNAARRKRGVSGGGGPEPTLNCISGTNWNL